jgi:ergothioneine biosynthesis protein EgtB
MNMTESAVRRPESLLRATWQDRYAEVRQQSERLCAPLQIEDYVIQTMPNVSPPKWHLAHVTWFFETFLLKPFLPSYREYSPAFAYLFNSYYQTVGEPYPRAKRGLLSRPGVEEVYRYRHYVDAAMHELIESMQEGPKWNEVAERLELGLHHEQQHQELLLTDIKHIFACNPLRPAYRPLPPSHSAKAADGATPTEWIAYPGGMQEIGHAGKGFHFDNETPRHAVLLQDYALGSRLVTNGEYLEFIEQGGYERADLWLSDGWNTVRQEGWTAPMYWEKQGSEWQIMTLCGMQPLQLDEPVCHISYYEADAYARWAGARLPTEAELECALVHAPVEGNFVDSERYHPAPAAGHSQWYGDVWEWTQSPYTPYPGYRAEEGALGEYNGKFMCNQLVLRGGSCATPRSHIRATYRNFFMPADRWQFTGIRLAKSGES